VGAGVATWSHSKSSGRQNLPAEHLCLQCVIPKCSDLGQMGGHWGVGWGVGMRVAAGSVSPYAEESRPAAPTNSSLMVLPVRPGTPRPKVCSTRGFYLAYSRMWRELEAGARARLFLLVYGVRTLPPLGSCAGRVVKAKVVRCRSCRLGEYDLCQAAHTYAHG
jgi:hypothetical protein